MIDFFIFVISRLMSSLDHQKWRLSGNDLIFELIMMMVGLDSLESLHKCRQVCTAWNAMIIQNIWESQSKRNIFKIWIKRNWGPEVFPTVEDISHARWLGKQ